MNETIFKRQDNKVAAGAGSSKVESTSKEQKSPSDKDAKVIRRFLEVVGPYEADALRIAIALADGKVSVANLTSDDQLALNRYLNSGLSKEQANVQEIQTKRLHRATQLSKRTADFCTKHQLSLVFEALMEFAVNLIHVEQARAGLDKMAASRAVQRPAGYSSIVSSPK